MTGPPPFKAGNRTRTGDPHLGKVVLYQLSYSRKKKGVSDPYPNLRETFPKHPSFVRWNLERALELSSSLGLFSPLCSPATTSVLAWGGDTPNAEEIDRRMKVRTIKQLAFLVLFIAPLGLGGQEFSDPLLAAGKLRIEISSLFHFADQRFGRRMEGGAIIEEDEPLGFDFSDTAVGSRLFPALEDLESDLATAVGAAVTPLVLGRTRAVLTKDAVWLPIRLDVGVFDWLTVGTTVPFSRRRGEFATSIQTDGANVGLTPATAGDFLGSVSAANNALSVIVTTLCTSNPSSPECSQASVLLAEGQAFHGALTDGADYGLFPLEGSVTGDALQSRTTSLLNAYQAVGAPSFPTAIPLATELLSEATYLDLVTNPALLGVGGDSLKTWRSPWELGDVEIHAYARLWGIGLETDPNEPRPAIRLEIGAGALIRIGTGRTDSPRNFIDTGSGDGQYDFELSGFGTLSVGRRVGVVAEVRYGIQRPVDVLRRIKAPDRIFAPLDPAEQVVRWNPGDYMQIRVSPRFYLTEEVAVAFDLRYFRKKSDRYSSVGGAVGPDPTVLELETKERSLGVGVGVVFSTVQSGLGRPLEVRFLVQEAVSGSGGATPKTWRLEVGLRLFWGLWGQDQAEGREN